MESFIHFSSAGCPVPASLFTIWLIINPIMPPLHLRYLKVRMPALTPHMISATCPGFLLSFLPSGWFWPHFITRVATTSSAASQSVPEGDTTRPYFYVLPGRYERRTPRGRVCGIDRERELTAVSVRSFPAVQIIRYLPISLPCVQRSEAFTSSHIAGYFAVQLNF